MKCYRVINLAPREISVVKQSNLSLITGNDNDNWPELLKFTKILSTYLFWDILI